MEQRESSTNRIEYIDIAKGIGIILVVFGHVIRGDNYPIPFAQQICYSIFSFHMPLFFIISGLCIKETKEFNLPTVKKMVKAYLIPYVVWTVVFIVLFQFEAVMKGTSILRFDNALFAHAISPCGLAPLWFLIALFFSEIITLSLKPFLNRTMVFIVLLVFLSMLTLVLSVWGFLIPNLNLVALNYLVGLCRIFPTTFFVILGYGLKKKLGKCVGWNLKKRTIVIIILICLQTLLCCIENDNIDIHLFFVGNQLLYFPKAIIGSLIILLFSQGIHSRLLTTIGNKTKEIMILHYPPFYWTLILREILGRLFKPNLIGGLTITAVTLTGCVLIDKLFSRFKLWKFVMGKKLV